MRKLFAQILPCGILPALSQHISRASELGIFENQYCPRCLPRDISDKKLLDVHGFEVLSQILPMLTGQNFFQTLSTILVESTLLGIAWDLLSRKYVRTCI